MLSPSLSRSSEYTEKSLSAADTSTTIIILKYPSTMVWEMSRTLMFASAR